MSPRDWGGPLCLLTDRLIIRSIVDMYVSGIGLFTLLNTPLSPSSHCACLRMSSWALVSFLFFLRLHSLRPSTCFTPAFGFFSFLQPREPPCGCVLLELTHTFRTRFDFDSFRETIVEHTTHIRGVQRAASNGAEDIILNHWQRLTLRPGVFGLVEFLPLEKEYGITMQPVDIPVCMRVCVCVCVCVVSSISPKCFVLLYLH